MDVLRLVGEQLRVHGIRWPAPAPAVEADRAPGRSGRDAWAERRPRGRGRRRRPTARRGPAPSMGPADVERRQPRESRFERRMHCRQAHELTVVVESAEQGGTIGDDRRAKAMWLATLCSPEPSGSHVRMSAMKTGASTRRPASIRYWTSTCSDRSMDTRATSLGSRRQTFMTEHAPSRQGPSLAGQASDAVHRTDPPGSQVIRTVAQGAALC